ncbi:MAG: hypothetical protein AAFQ65_16185, partial [Myxococcota bacterium]
MINVVDAKTELDACALRDLQVIDDRACRAIQLNDLCSVVASTGSELVDLRRLPLKAGEHPNDLDIGPSALTLLDLFTLTSS